MPAKRKVRTGEGEARAIPVLDWEAAGKATDPERLFKQIQSFEKQARLWNIGRRTRKRPWPDGECLAGVVIPMEEADVIRAICRELIITQEEFVRFAVRAWMFETKDTDGAHAFRMSSRTVRVARDWLAQNRSDAKIATPMKRSGER